MADDVAVKADDWDRLPEAMAKCPKYLYEEWKVAGGRYLAGWIGKFKRENVTKGGDGVNTRSGALRRAFTQVVHGTDLDSLRFVAGTVHVGLPYAHIQEFGGVVTPKRAKWLTIPLAAAKTPAGVARFSARDALSRDNVHFIRTKRGRPMIVEMNAKSWKPLFLLVKRVKIAKRLGFFDSWKRADPGFTKALGQGIGKALRRWAADERAKAKK